MLPPAREQTWTLKKLSPRHRDIAALIVDGELSLEAIGAVCGCTAEYLTMLKQQPLFREFVEKLYKEIDEKFRSLYNKTVDAVDAGLTSTDVKDKLKAAEIYLKAHGKSDGGQNTPATAEDVIARMLNLQVNVNVSQPSPTVHNMNTSEEGV